MSLGLRALNHFQDNSREKKNKINVPTVLLPDFPGLTLEKVKAQ